MKLQYVSFYDHEINTKENRVFSPAGRDITAYVAGALTRASINVEIISLACTDSKNFHYKGKTYETPEGFKVTLPPTLGGYGKFMKFIRNIWTVLLPYLYLFPRIKSGSTILVYHSVSLVIPVRILQLLKRVKVILQVEEIYADVTNNESYRRLESLAFKKAHAFIFPTVSLQNMIESTHSVADIRLVPRRNQKLMYKKVYEISFPLKHPNDIKRNVNYDRKYKVSRFGRYCDLIEIGIRRVLWGRKK